MLLDRAWRAMKYRIDQRARAAREARTYRDYRTLAFTDVDALLDAHFSTWADPHHVNRPGFDAALRLAAGAPQLIVETGTSAWGTDSTRLWDAYVCNFGGEFWTVDLSGDPRARLRDQVGPRTHLEVDDSVHFLDQLAEQRPTLHVDLCYLDSWDLDWDDPEPAALHGLNEWHAVEPLIGPGSILIIDDSPGTMEWVPEHLRDKAAAYLDATGRLPGKGELIDVELSARPDVKKVWHGYNAVYQFLAAGDS